MSVDPSESLGFKILKEFKQFFQVRNPSNPLAEDMECIVRILESLKSIRVEIMDDADLFHCYSCTLEKDKFKEFKSSQSLTIEWGQFPQVLTEMFTNCKENPEEYPVKIICEGDDLKTIEFSQSLKLRAVVILTLELKKEGDGYVNAMAQYRFDEARNLLIQRRKEVKSMKAMVAGFNSRK